ncbi:MAG: hypothetical protein Q8R37_03290 [Nanoarchaeota archaeon]|nr:hypothetical protein [Nanoarchaeota archaeon]
MNRNVAATLISLVMACGPDTMVSPTPMETPPAERSYPVDIPELETADPKRPGYPAVHGYPHGTIIIDGGGNYGLNGSRLFRDAIDPDSESWADLPVVVVPTALPDCPVPPGNACVDDGDLDYQLRQVYLRNITLLHTRTPTVADTEEFVEPLQTARGVWFTGGRQWRLADAYLGTKFMDELRGVLDRGGVVGGTSARCVNYGFFSYSRGYQHQ